MLIHLYTWLPRNNDTDTTPPLSWVHSAEPLPHMLTGINYKCPEDADMSPEGMQILLGKRTFASTLMSVL